MNVINKQKFLAELGRLLTFMTEEDRIEALTLYEKMFDDADDEQSLLHALQSPTRQAVVIARSYDAGSHGRDEDEEEQTPLFVRAILKVYEDNVTLPPEPQPEPVPAPAPIPEPDPEPVATRKPEPEPVPAPVPAREPEPVPAPAPELRVWDLPEPPAEKDVVLPTVIENQVSLFDEPAFAAPEADEQEETDALEDWLNSRRQPEHTAREQIVHNHHYHIYDEDDEDDEDEETRTVTNIPLLVLFALLAVPLTVCAIALLLIPTLLSLVLSAASIVTGCWGMLAAFGGFAVFADILIVFGCAVVALALGLLFLWLFIWFVICPIAGLVRWVIHLGSRWCSKEVPV